MAAEEQQQQHWRSAQSLVVGLDLVAAAQAQLRLLAAVHSHAPALYQGPSLQHAIRRYESCWLPLLAHHGVSSCNGLHLVPPLDCAWIWHCHRLNPVQYIKDCETHYGMLLDSQCAFTDENIEAIAHTRQLWDARFPGEEYDINLDEPQKEAVDYDKRITYDLQAAVERQSSFFYQVSRPYMGNESFLKGSLERYKGFLYLLKLCGLRAFLVPTYDIDLMWHSHQDSPRVYRQDTIKLLGKVLNHDDMDSDRSEGKKLDTGFNTTRVLWQTTFGTSYERAGTMYRGEQPASFFQTAPGLWAHGLAPFAEKQTGQVPQPIQGMPHVHARETMQVFITVHTARNLHMSQSSTLAVELLFQDKCKSLKMATSWYEGAQNPKWNHLWTFQCEKGTKGIRLELRSKRMSCFNMKTTSRLIGWVDVSWESLITSPTLSWDGWLPLQMTSKCGVDQKPTSLKISASITPPVMGPSLFWIKHPTMDRKEGCLSRCLYDHTHTKSAVIKIRGSYIGKTFHPLLVEVCPYGYSDREKALGEILAAANLLHHDDKKPAMGTAWSLLDDAMRLTILKDTMTATGDRQPNVHLEASSHNLVRLLHGRRLEYEVVGGNQADEEGFFTLVRYTPDAGFGRATALFNWKLGLMEVAPEENGVLALLLCTILAVSFNSTGESWKKTRRDTKSSDEWGSVMLTGHHCARAQCLPCFAPWYSMSSVCWIDHRAGGVAAVAPCFKKVGSGCGCCGAGGCGGCGSGAGSNGSISRTSRGAKCGGCGSGCGGCGAGGGNSLTDVAKSNLGAAGCGGCGAGGCMNGVKKGLVMVKHWE